MSRTWPYILGGVALAGTAAIVSIVALGDDGPSRREKAEVAARSAAAEMERQHAREIAEEKMHAAQAAAVAAAEQAKLEAEKLKAEQDVKLARQKAIEAARTQGILGSSALVHGGAFASLTGTDDISSGFDDSDLLGGLVGNEAGELAGGFGPDGATGSGPGGGGQGTIGLGSYGTLGHGTGTGAGYGIGGGRGGLAGRTAARPSVRLTVSQVTGDLDTNIVRRILRRNQAKLQYCYEKQLLVEPALAGTITARFEIGSDGSVTSSNASGVNDEVASCMATVIRGAAFPSPKSGTVSATSTIAVKPAS
jgi:hypothetical protein